MSEQTSVSAEYKLFFKSETVSDNHIIDPPDHLRSLFDREGPFHDFLYRLLPDRYVRLSIKLEVA